MSNKVVIWGYPPDTHTHSYIHFGFAKAFSEMDYDVTWYEDSPDYSNEDLSDSIVISGYGQCKYLPIDKSSKYFIHNIVDGFYSQDKIEGDNIYNLLVYHENYNWNDDISNIDEYSWYDDKTKTVVIMWGTDLLPEEIDEQNEVLYDPDKKNVNYIGSLNPNDCSSLVNVVRSNKKEFVNYGGYSGIKSKSTGLRFLTDQELISLTKESYLNFDIRSQSHVDNGFIPCRIFKNLSYGCWTGTNSEKISKFFDKRITCNSNLSELYYQTEEDVRNATLEIIRDNMNYIKNNHTYINRVNTLIKIL